MGTIHKKLIILIIIFITSLLSSCLPREKLVDTTPPPDMLLLMQAKKMLDLGNINAAEYYVDKFVILFPTHANYSYVLYLKGEIAFRRGELMSAYNYFKMAKKLTKDPILKAKIIRRMLFIESILHLKNFASLFP